MMYETKVGNFEISDENIINFDSGIPGFETFKKFSIISLIDTEPVKWLASLEDKNLALPIIDPWIAFKDYTINLSESVLQELENPKKENVIVFCVIALKPTVTVNLLAPIVVNLEKGMGIQAILSDTNYTTKHPIRM